LLIAPCALRFSIAFALIGKKARGRKLALTEEERYEIADHVIRDMRKYGQWVSWTRRSKRQWGRPALQPPDRNLRICEAT
jgi:L-serine deaminase